MSHRRTIFQALLAGALLASLSRVPASAAEPDDAAFSLLREQMVTGVSKRPLPLSETPSSVTVIPAAEIRAMGYQTLGDALRWVRGVFVTYDRTYTNVGVRGLQRPGDFNNKLLLTINGHTMNGSVYGDALIGPELGLDMEEVERIEIARGPGSALYGSYAVLAVVNVVTRQPRSDPGTRVDVRAGGANEWRTHASIASARPGRAEWRASVSWLEARGRELALPASIDGVEYPGLAVARDHERALAFFGDADWGPVRLVVKFNERQKAQMPASYTMPVSDNSSPAWDGHDFVELSATRRTTPALELSGRAYWDGSRTRARFVSLSEPGSEPLVNLDFGNADVVGAEGRAIWSIATMQTLTLGLEAQRMVSGRLLNYDVAPYELYYDRSLTGGALALYLQDEARLGRRLILTAGARLDNDSRYRAVVSPRADLVWTMAPATRLKLLGGSAFRAPSPGRPSPTPWAPPWPAAGSLPSGSSPSRGPSSTRSGPIGPSSPPTPAASGTSSTSCSWTSPERRTTGTSSACAAAVSRPACASPPGPGPTRGWRWPGSGARTAAQARRSRTRRAGTRTCSPSTPGATAGRPWVRACATSRRGSRGTTCAPPRPSRATRACRDGSCAASRSGSRLATCSTRGTAIRDGSRHRRT